MILKDWITKSGLRALVIKNCHVGHNCGYVGIPENHPLYGKDYSQHCDVLIPLRNKIKNESIGKRGIIPIFCWDGESASIQIIFNVHGGVTFSGTHKLVKSKLWWIGYDCGHSGDTPEKCDLKYCIKECESLAKQLKLVKSAKPKKRTSGVEE
jgi:hypothetical protein